MWTNYSAVVELEWALPHRCGPEAPTGQYDGQLGPFQRMAEPSVSSLGPAR